MTSIDLAANLSWRCLDLPLVAHYFPILITNSANTTIERNFISRFQVKKTDWVIFNTKGAIFNEKFEKSTNINKEAAQINPILRSSADESIPLNRKPAKENNSIWFNSQNSSLILARQNSL